MPLAVITPGAGSDLKSNKEVVADSMLFIPALVLVKAIAPYLAVSFPTLSDAHWA